MRNLGNGKRISKHRGSARRAAGGLVIVFVALTCATAQESSEKRKRVLELLELTKWVERETAIMLQLFGGIRGSQRTTRELEAAATAKPNELRALLVPVYMKHLDMKMLDALISFYGSPAGKRYLERESEMMSDVASVRMKWFGELVTRIVRARKEK